jgi:FHA domain
MTGGSPGAGQPVGRRPRAPLSRRSRKRWAIAAGVALCWLTLVVMTSSVATATVAVIALSGFCVLAVMGLRALGVTGDHPWLRRLAERPWRDGQDVLQVALRHLADVFVIAPSGAVLAPDLVELRMSPRDLSSLGERMELGLVAACATEAYLDHAAARGARFPGHVPPEVRVVADPAVPAGRYRLRQGLPVGSNTPSNVGMYPVPAYSLGAINPPAGSAYPGFVGHDGNTRVNSGTGQTAAGPDPAAYAAGLATVQVEPVLSPTTVREPERTPVPVLRLITGDSTAETRVPGARAGRGPVELTLPDMPTVSREHARFTFSDGRWWIANLGRNGLTLNGVPLVGEQPLSDGDSIRWGMRPDALLSRVQIG